MEPILCVGLAGAIVSFINVVTQSVNSLLYLQATYKNANLEVSLLIW